MIDTKWYHEYHERIWEARGKSRAERGTTEDVGNEDQTESSRFYDPWSEKK